MKQLSTRAAFILLALAAQPVSISVAAEEPAVTLPASLVASIKAFGALDNCIKANTILHAKENQSADRIATTVMASCKKKFDDHTKAEQQVTVEQIGRMKEDGYGQDLIVEFEKIKRDNLKKIDQDFRQSIIKQIAKVRAAQ